MPHKIDFLYQGIDRKDIIIKCNKKNCKITNIIQSGGRKNKNLIIFA